MLRRVALCLTLAGSPQFAAAQSVQDQIVGQLRAQGFSEITLNRTWLGRVRVVAVRDDLRRELVFNPQTGEILRDYWRSIEEGDDVPLLFNPGSGSQAGGGTGSATGGGFEDDDEDDGDEDDDDEDEDDDEDDDDDDDDDDDEEDDDESDDD